MPYINNPSSVLASTSSLMGAWTAYTPTVTAQVGTFTTVSATGAYIQIGKTVHVRVSVTITNAGTAASGCQVTLPITARTGINAHGSGRENAATGVNLNAWIGGITQMLINKYDGTTAIATGNQLNVSITYEAA